MARPRLTDTHRAMLNVIGQNARACRIESGVSLEELAEAVGADRQYISEVEAGKVNISATRIVEIASALGIDAGRLFAGIN